MAQLITGSICLSDIPKDKIQTGKNGKKYLNICISELQNISAYGDTHTIYVSQSKEERQAKAPKAYIGHGKNYAAAQAPQAAPPQTPANPSYQPPTAPPVNIRVSNGSDDELPF
jgi:hypothetical protein